MSANVQIECSKPQSEFSYPLEMIYKVQIEIKNLVGLFFPFMQTRISYS